MCAKRSRSRPENRFGGSSILNNRHRALKCLLNVSSSNLYLSGYHKVVNRHLVEHARGGQVRP